MGHYANRYQNLNENKNIKSYGYLRYQADEKYQDIQFTGTNFEKANLFKNFNFAGY